LSTFEDNIVVKPQPALQLEYLLPFEVFADEPLTEDVIEPVEPFPLGVRIVNVGYGPARNFRINSGQPEILENKLGLAVDFKLLGTYVGATKVPDSLLLQFGDIPAGGADQAAWIMSTSLSGRFTQFKATFTHSAELGGELTSLIRNVTTYTLVKDVLVDLPGRDGQFDFLVNTTTPRGEIEALLSGGGELTPDLILESESVQPAPVTRLSGELTGDLGGAEPVATLRFTQETDPWRWVFMSVPAPQDGRAKPLSAVRQDGKAINPRNIWLSRHFVKATREYLYRLNLLDYGAPPLASYTLNFSRETLDEAPAAVADLSGFSVPLGGSAGLAWSAPGEDGDSGGIIGGKYFIQAATAAEAGFAPEQAQVNFATSTAPGAPQNYIVRGLAGNATYYFGLWTQDTGGNMSGASNRTEVYAAPNPPAGLEVVAVSSYGAAVTWAAGNNYPPVEYMVLAGTGSLPPFAAESPFQDPFDREYEFTGLLPATTYYFHGLARVADGGAFSELVYLGQALTSPAPEPPIAREMTPSSGPIGIPFVITGSGFGTYAAGFTTVLIGGATAPLTLWSTTTINGTVPGSLAAGEYPVLVMRGSEVLSETSSFTVVLPALADITPSSGPIGLPFALNGTGFGNYVANYTRVLIGGTTCPLTLWSDTQIKGTVPGVLAAGAHEVIVERELNGGLAASQTLAFTLTVSAIVDITPSSGPIGLPFALNGTGFGNYVANYTRVLIGGATCPLTLWTDTQIKGTIPGTIAPGVHEVLVEREFNGGLVRSAPVSFDLRNMEADWIAPSSGPIGMPFTIAGSGFGDYRQNFTYVLIGGATAPLTLWTDTQINGTVPGGLSSGLYPVLAERRTTDGGLMSSNTMYFEVLAVDAASMTPVAGPIGLPFTIYGTGFGNYSAGWTRVLIGGTTAPLTLWSDTQIKGTVPGILAAGPHEVIVERELNGGLIRSSALNFDVVIPSAQLITPSSGPIGLPFVIDGAWFGNYVANYTRVLIGGTTCPLTLWTDTQIKGTVPGTIEPGAHEVVVERQLNGGLAASQPLSFELADPVLEAVSPSSAAVLSPFTLTGYNFGNYVAGKSETLIGGATAQLTLWTNTQIKGKLPALGEGDYPVLVRRSFNGGVSQSAPSTMTVLEPSVSSMTPTAGTGGEVFNIYGSFLGPYDAAIARVLIGGLPAELTLWNDDVIKGKIPDDLEVGTHTVIAARGQYLSDPLELLITGGYNPMFFDPLSPAAAFRAGQIYVYPNPAKGGVAPVFHLEFGLADKLELKVYNVAGTLVHERVLTGFPQVTKNVYAYEYAWEGHIASGVYYFTVEAERAGSKLKSRGKFAVVR